MSTKNSARNPGQFVKSWNTKVEVSRSKETLEDLLRRYGATGFTVSEDYETRTVVVVFFIRPTPNDDPIEIRLPVSYKSVLDRLKRMREFTNSVARKPHANREAHMMAQSARVAWRMVNIWADAALSMVDAGVYSLPEAFFAHAMIETPSGQKVRAVDAVTAMKLLPSGR